MSVSISGAGSISGLDQGFNVTTGSVGIGTDNPLSKLHLSNTGAEGLEIYIANSSNVNVLQHYNRSASSYVTHRSNALDHRFETSGSEKLRITSGGSVGFNTTFTQSSKTVHIAGDYRSVTQNVADEGLIFQSFTTASTGDVYPGISWTGNPTALGRARASINAIATNDNNGSDIVFLTRNAADGTELDVTDDEKLRITSDGKMGLGTQTPADKLSISGGSLGIYNTGNSHGNVYFYKDGTPKGWLKYRGDNDKLIIGNVTDAIHVLSSGNVAIGHDSAPTKLGIRGTSASTDATVQIVGNGVSTLLLGQDAAGGVIRGQGGSNQLKFKVGGGGDDAAATGGVEALRISSGGDATFKYKVTIGDSYAGGEILSVGKSSGTSYMAFHNGGANMGFIGYADQLISGGASNELGIRSQDDISFATGGNSETLRLTTAGYAYFGSYPTTHTVMGGSPIKVRSGAGAWGISIGMRYSQNDYGYIGFSDMNGTENLGDIHVNRTGTNAGRMAFSTNNGSGSLQRLRIEPSGNVIITDDGAIKDQRMPLVITGQGFGHGHTQGGTTQDTIYMTAGASGNYSTLTLTVNKVSWGSIAYEIHCAAYNGRHLHRVGGFYQNGNNISGDSGTTTASSGSSFSISAPASQQFTMTVGGGGHWTHPSAWVRLSMSGNGYLRSDLITLAWS